MTDKPGMERKVYLLSKELMDRINAYRIDQGIASEVETARRLLERALDALDTPTSIMARLKKEHAMTHNLRETAQRVLATHILVTTIEFSEKEISFCVVGSDMSVKFAPTGSPRASSPP